SEEEKRREIEEQMTALTAPTTPLTALGGVGPKTIEKLEEAGITSLEKLAGMTPEQLMEIPGIGEKMVDKIYQAVNRFYEGGGEAAPAGETTDAEETAEEQAAANAESENAPAEESQVSESETVTNETEAEAANAATEPEKNSESEGKEETNS